jgi:hypothetical protein
MDKLTDLEVCKRIAEIEGYTLNSEWGVADENSVLVNIRDDKFTIFNPLTDKALCFDFLTRHSLNLHREWSGLWSACNVCTYDHDENPIDFDTYESDESPQRAICLAIIAKHEVNNG